MSAVNRGALSGLRHVATILGRWRCEFDQHRYPRSNNDNGGAGRAGHGQQAATALLFGFDSGNDPDHLSSDGCAYNRSIRVGFGVLDIRCGSRGADLVYFAFVNYATLGYGDVLPVERWRLLGPLTAMNGMLLYGWSTAVIFEVLRRTLVRTLDIKD